MIFIMWFSIGMIKLGYAWNARWHFNTSHLTKAYNKMRYTFVSYRWSCAVSSTLTFLINFPQADAQQGKGDTLPSGPLFSSIAVGNSPAGAFQTFTVCCSLSFSSCLPGPSPPMGVA